MLTSTFSIDPVLIEPTGPPRVRVAEVGGEDVDVAPRRLVVGINKLVQGRALAFLTSARLQADTQ